VTADAERVFGARSTYGIDGRATWGIPDQFDRFSPILPHGGVGGAAVGPNAPAKITKQAREAVIAPEPTLPIRFKKRSHRVERFQLVQIEREFTSPAASLIPLSLLGTGNVRKWAQAVVASLPAQNGSYS
jgi:hypothetical protein